MCGLVGMAGAGVTTKDLKMLQDMAYVAGLRGSDSTGVLQGNTVYRKVDYIIEKMDSDISYFTWYQAKAKGGNTRIFDSVTDNFFMVHLRHATRGGITKDNAHPFEKETFIGMHNGTLFDQRYSSGVKTDSELLFEDIDARGIKPVLSELKDNSNAYALVLFNKETEEISIVKNGERSLYCAFNKDRAVFYWASEAWMITAIAGRLGIEVGPCAYFRDHMIHTFKPTDVNRGKFPTWRVDAFEPFREKGVDYSGVWGDIFDREEKKNESPKKTGEEEKEGTGEEKIEDNSPFDTNVFEANKGSNVVPLHSRPKIRPKVKVRKESLHKKCVTCSEDMNLVAQHFGHHDQATNTYQCTVCYDMIERLQNSDVLRAVEEKKVNGGILQ